MPISADEPITKELLKEYDHLLEAIRQGKTIQRKAPGYPWKDLEYVYLNLPAKQYRVKPEPKYRPFTLDELRAYIGAIVKGKNHVTHRMVIGVTKTGAYIGGADRVKTCQQLFDDYEFVDGLPCGVVDSDDIDSP